MEKISQEQVWNKIAEPWQTFRKRTLKEVEDFLSDKKGRILDLGCGSGRNLIAIKDIEYYGVDFSEQMLKFAQEKTRKDKVNAVFFKSELTKLPFKDNFFDAAIFISSLHCIEKKEGRKKALLELYRVLKKGGEAIITVWNKEQNELAKDLGAKEGYVNWKKDKVNYQRYYYFYDKKELEKLLRDTGFEIRESEKKDEASRHSKKNLVFYVQK